MATATLIFKGSSKTVRIPGSTADFTVRIVVDNGSDSIADQEWRDQHFVSAELTSGSYKLRWPPAQQTRFFAKTDQSGKVVQAALGGLTHGADVFADSAVNGGHLTAASNNRYIRDTQMRENIHSPETEASMRKSDENNHLWSVEQPVKGELLVPDLAESYARFDGRTGAFSQGPWHLEPGHSAQHTIDSSGMTGNGLAATHEATHAGNWLARDNQKFGVLRYRWNAPVRLEGIALWQASNFRGGFSWKSFDVWVKQGDAYVRVAHALSMPNPPQPGAFRVDFPRTAAGVTEVVLEIHAIHSVDGRIEAGLGEFRAIGEPDPLPLAEVRISEITEAAIKRFTVDGLVKESNERATIRNFGGKVIDLSGWTLNCGAKTQNFIFPVGTKLGPDEEVHVWTAPIRDARPGRDFTLGRAKSRVWSNKGDVGRLLHADGHLVNEVRYGDQV